MVWAALAALILGGLLEAVALRRPRQGDTFSEWAWTLRRRPVGAALITAALTWTLYHLVLEADRLALTVWWDDVALVALTATLGYLFGARPAPGGR